MYQLDLNIFNLIIIASVFVGFVFSVLLIFTKRVNQRANLFLGLLSLVIVLWNIWVLSLDLDVFRYFPKFYLLPVNFSLALGPLLFFYTKKLTQPGWIFEKRHFIHFIPLLFEIFVHIVLCVEALNNNILATDTSSFYILIPIVQLFAIISILFYCYKARHLILAYHEWIKTNFSNDNKYNLRWLYRLVMIFAGLWFMLVPYTFIDYALFDFKLGIRDYYPIYILLSVIALWISIEAFLKPEMIFLEVERKSRPKSQTNRIVEVSEEVKAKAKWLDEEMKRNLYYLDAGLSLRSLASEIDMHPNNLSKIINEGLGKNFSEFINIYRVNAVIDRLNDPRYDHITLLGISFECGFNSKTTFNRVFKSITGKTPFDYKRQLTTLEAENS